MNNDEKKSNIISFRRFARSRSKPDKTSDVDRSDRFVWKEDDLDHHPDNDDVKESLAHKVYPHLDNMQQDSGWKNHVKEHEVSDDEQERFRQHWNNMDPHDKAVGIDYKRFSGDTNYKLRTSINHGGGRLVVHETPDVFKKKISSLEKVTSIPTGEDMHVYRGFDPAVSKFYSLPRGHEFTDHGFTGTSLSPNVGSDFAAGYGDTNSHHFDPKLPPRLYSTPHIVLAKIHVPRGTLGHYLDVPDGIDAEHRHSHEKEFLLHRGTKFRIDGHQQIGHQYDGLGTHLIHLTVTGQHPKKLHYIGEKTS